jgi:hypothetical protein
MDKKTIAIIVLSVLVVILGWVAFKPKPNPYNDSLLKHELERLKTANDSLIKGIAKRDTKIIGFNAKIDSLQNLKPIIQTIYVTKYKEIDNASAGTIANEFTNVFTNAGIK